MSATATADLGSTLGALANPARLRVVELLSAAPGRPADLATDLGVSRPTMSRHLAVLLAAGLVVDERSPEDARARVFRLRHEPVAALGAWLDQIEAHWDEQLTAFKTHADTRART